VLLIERSEIKDNYSISHGAGICNWNGYNDNPHGEVEIYNSLFSGNTAGEYGAGFYSVSDNTSIIENSTFQGNTAAANGGAISAYYLQMTNVTISQNSAPEGSGIYSWYDIAMVNSIIAGNTNSSQCSANTSAELTSQGHNISSDNSCDLNGPGDMPNTNPQLGPLQNNGGPTFTMALSAGSPAINTADNAACPPTDQRGVPRPQGPACDIGAYEYNG
jgi:predicted outer membrane repeat protein